MSHWNHWSYLYVLNRSNCGVLDQFPRLRWFDIFWYLVARRTRRGRYWIKIRRYWLVVDSNFWRNFTEPLQARDAFLAGWILSLSHGRNYLDSGRLEEHLCWCRSVYFVYTMLGHAKLYWLPFEGVLEVIIGLQWAIRISGQDLIT